MEGFQLKAALPEPGHRGAVSTHLSPESLCLRARRGRALKPCVKLCVFRLFFPRRIGDGAGGGGSEHLVPADEEPVELAVHPKHAEHHQNAVWDAHQQVTRADIPGNLSVFAKSLGFEQLLYPVMHQMSRFNSKRGRCWVGSPLRL